VLVDARALNVSGIGRYLREVLRRLIADDRFGPIHLLGDVGELTAFAGGLPGSERVRYRAFTPRFYSPRVQLEWLRMASGDATDHPVGFFPHFDAPLLRMPARSVVTIQDLIHFMVPDAFPAWRRLAAGLVLRRVTGTAQRLIVSSESTRRDLIGRLPGTAEKIEVVPFGVEPSPTSEAHLESAEEAMAKGLGPFVLCVGNRKPHKNLVAAVEALGRLPAEFRSVKLVIAGAYFGGDSVSRRAMDLGLGDRVIELGKVSDPQLQSLYRNCEALLFPSLYEGFGLPVLEAMAAGAPVVASDSSSIPEVVGDAGVLVGPRDHQAMADAIVRILAEPGHRESLVSRGRRRAATFSWDATTARIIELIWETARGSSTRDGTAVGAGRADTSHLFLG
jgi:glycosyltransferase involved in cell wall biosynthesis